MLRAYAGPRFRGIVHGFSEGPSIAERYVKLGFMLSIGAAVMTSGKLARTLRTVGAEHIVVESDSPDQPPEGFRPVEGAPANEPASIRLIAAKISDLRGETVEQVLDTGRRNLIRQGLLREPE
jgi:TatD DNase family protein